MSATAWRKAVRAALLSARSELERKMAAKKPSLSVEEALIVWVWPSSRLTVEEVIRAMDESSATSMRRWAKSTKFWNAALYPLVSIGMGDSFCRTVR